MVGYCRFELTNSGLLMPQTSAGLLMYRLKEGQLRVLLAHPGGPFFKSKDEGAWSIPKGVIDANEEPLAAACREFSEEIGIFPEGPFLELTPVKQKGGKTVHAWAFEGDCDPAAITSNVFAIEWPPRSGRMVEFPEIDRAEFFDLDQAKRKINPAQAALVHELAERIAKLG
jgi:predicted NUDIX family NTP pyrophosphohydrolase